jgi:UTP--glucose-1-phosphate uridylyltransferase
MQSLTRGTAKELLEVAGVPVLIRVLEECVESGIEEVLIVISPDKDEIAQRVAPLAGTDRMPRSISFAIQKEPRGLADAVRLGRDFAGSGPLAVALPDNLFGGAAPGLAQVVDTYRSTAKSVVAIVEITQETASRFGPTAVYAGQRRGVEFEIESIPDKGAKGSTFDTQGLESAFTGVGRYVFTPDAFEAIDSVERRITQGRELDDVPVMQLLLSQNRLIGRIIEGRFFDVGIPSGYTGATAEYSGVETIA